MTHKLDATVFVYRHRETQKIAARYLEDARALEDSEEWEHLATLEPRMWIEYHYDDRIDERRWCAELCRMMGPTKREMSPARYDICHACADAIECRGEE